MASALKLKNDIRKLKTAIDNKATNPKFLPKLKEQLEKLEGDLAKLKKPTKSGKKPYVRAEGSALAKLKNKLKSVEKQYKGYSGKTPLSLERDANRPAKPIGKRKSKSGNTYYEYRANRIDVKQPPRVFPKLEDGGYMANEGKYLRTLPTQDDLYAFMVLDKKSGFGAPLDYKVYGKIQAKKIKEKYEDKIEKDRELKMFSVKELLDRKSFGAQNKQMIEEEFKRSVAQIKQMMESLNINDYKELYLEDGGYMEEGGYMKGGGKLSLKKFRDKYDENEDANMHSENVVLLAQNFGSDSDIRDAKTILAKHEAIGSLPYYLSQERNALHDKLWAKYQEEVREKGIKEEGGYMAEGGRVMPFLKFEYATEARKKLDKGQLPVFDGGIGFDYLEKEKKLYYLPSVIGDWQEVGEFISKKEAIDWLSERLKMEGFAKGGYMATGGATEHGIMKGDHVVDIYEDTLVIENGGKKYFVFIKTGEREQVAEKGGYMTHGGETHRSEKK